MARGFAGFPGSHIPRFSFFASISCTNCELRDGEHGGHSGKSSRFCALDILGEHGNLGLEMDSSSFSFICTKRLDRSGLHQPGL